MAIASPNSHFSSVVERTGQWVFSQEIPADVVVEIGDSTFPLHKFMLVARSGHLRRRILEANPSEAVRVDLSGVPGGAEAFEKAAKFCYGVNFEITVHNVAALRCAAEYLEMTEEEDHGGGGGGGGGLAGRAEEFLSQAALKTLPGAAAVLRSCEEGLLPWAEELRIVQRCVDVISLKACNESNFPTRSPPEWWAAELAALGPASFQKVLSAMRSRGASPQSLTAAVAAYAELSLPDLLSSRGGAAASASASASASAGDQLRRRALLESIVSLLPPDRDAPLPVGFVCLLLRAAIALAASAASRRELERRIAASLDQATAADLLAVTLDPSGERIADLDSARRIIAGFVERESAGSGAGGLLYGGGAALCSAAVQNVARIVDAFIGEIATDEDLSVSKFAGIAGALPKSARRFDDDLYRAIDIYLKAHPGLDEIEREKVCSVMDPLRLSYEARLHASQNKRLPLQIVLHALYYDQLKLRSSSTASQPQPQPQPQPRPNPAAADRAGDASLAHENEALRSELARMRVYVTELERANVLAPPGPGGSKPTLGPPKKPTFFASVSRTLGKLNPFRHGGAKDTSMLDDPSGGVGASKPRRRRFSIS